MHELADSMVLKLSQLLRLILKSIILSLKSKNSSGSDEITGKILKACASLSQPLSHIYNHSLYTGVFPDTLKFQ
jgi:hypothetical protein